MGVMEGALYSCSHDSSVRARRETGERVAVTASLPWQRLSRVKADWSPDGNSGTFVRRVSLTGGTRVMDCGRSDFSGKVLESKPANLYEVRPNCKLLFVLCVCYNM